LDGGPCDAEQLLAAQVLRERTRQRPTEYPYALRGLLKCGICGSTMQGSFRKSRGDDPGRVLYRCEIRRSRALPRGFEHPATVHVRQDVIVDKIDQWISSLASAKTLTAGQVPDPVIGDQRAALGRRLTDTQHNHRHSGLTSKNGAAARGPWTTRSAPPPARWTG